MSSEHIEVRQLISALTPRFADCQERLRDQEIGNALYGMQGMVTYHSTCYYCC